MPGVTPLQEEIEASCELFKAKLDRIPARDRALLDHASKQPHAFLLLHDTSVEYLFDQLLSRREIKLTPKTFSRTHR